MGKEQEQAGKSGAGDVKVPVETLHPRARAFMREVAEARRAKRQAMAELDPESPLFQALTGAGKGRGSGLPGGVRPVPGEGIGPPAPAATGPGTEAGVTPLGPGGVRFGLNMLHSYELDYQGGPWGYVAVTKYGTDREPILDAGRLGARVVRQFGRRDLVWDWLVPMSGVDPSSGLPVASDVPANATDIETRLASGDSVGGTLAQNADLLAEVLLAARESGVKLVFTFLTLGTWTTLSPDDGCSPVTNSVEYVDAPGVPGSVIDENGSVSDFAALGWADEHRGATSPTLGAPFPADAACTSGAEWYLDSLDPACPYKREFIGIIAAKAAVLLLDAAARAKLDLASVVEAIEIFNEVDSRDFWELHGSPSPEAAGAKWGQAFLHAAWHFRAALPADVKIWMPGISSASDLQGKSWDDKLDWVRGFVNGMNKEAYAATAALTGASSGDAVRGRFSDLLQGVDLHWYDTLGRGLHIGFLALQVRELADAVSDALTRVTENDVRVPVSVLENGWGLDDSLPAGMRFDPRWWVREEIQAWEVWRRMGGALAGGASIVGWHSWMSTFGGNFPKMGLRVDIYSSAMTPACDADPRPSWKAYAVLAEVLGDRVVSGSMLLPLAADRVGLSAALARSTVAGVVVLEYRLGTAASLAGGLGSWAYLVFLDTRTPPPVGEVRVVATPAGSASVSGGIRVYGFDNSERVVTRGSATALSVIEVTPVFATLPMAAFTVTPRWEPQLFVSPRELAWRIVRASSSTSAQALHDRPGWLDDAGIDPCQEERPPKEKEEE